MADIFVSYATPDRARVAPIVDALQSRGWSVWWDRDLIPGPSFDREIEKAMDACRCVVVVWSKHSTESNWVRTEASEGAQRNILIPVLIDEVRPPLAFRYLQSADLSGARRDADHHFQQFLAAVGELVGGATVPAASDSRGEFETPPGRRATWWAGIAAGVVGLVTLVAATVYWLAPLPEPDQRFPAPSIAVLPLQYSGTDQDGRYFADGLTEALIEALGEAQGLRVAALESSFFYQDNPASAADVARAMMVRYVLQGSVHRAGDDFELALELQDTETGRVAWRDRVDGELVDLIDVQEDVVRQLLGATLSRAPAAAAGQTSVNPTDSPEAYDAYLQGRAMLRQLSQANVHERALASFDQALRLDPNYAEAHAGRCEAFLSRYRRGRDQRDFVNAESACHRALTLTKPGATSWETLVALGNLYRAAGQNDKAIAALQRANDLQPSSAEVLHNLGLANAQAGHTPLAEAQLRRAIQIDPAYWDARVALGSLFYDTGRFELAARTLGQVLEVVPNYPGALIGLGSAKYMLGERAEATELWLRAERNGVTLERGSMAMLHSNLGLGYYYDGAFEEAVASQLTAVRLAPNDHRIWGRLAESYRGARQAELARESYLKAIALAHQQLLLNPSDWETLGLLGLYYAFTQQPDQAARYTSQMLADHRSNATAHYFAALAHSALDSPDDALAALAEALELGFSRAMIEADPDLRALRANHPEKFAALLHD